MENTDRIGELAEQLDSSLFMLQNTKGKLPADIHVEGLSGTMREVRDALAEIYKQSGGTEDLDFAAQ